MVGGTVGRSWDAFGRLLADNRWIAAALAAVSAAGTFILAGQTVALMFTATIFAVLFLAALHSLGKQSGPNSDGKPITTVGRSPVHSGQAELETSVTSGADKEAQPIGESGKTGDDGDPPAEMAAFNLAWDGDIDGLREIYALELSKATTEDDRNSCSAIHEFLLVKAGALKSIDTLAKMVEDRLAPAPRILGLYASALGLVGEQPRAIHELLSRSESFSVDDRANCVLQAADAQVAMDRETEARDLVLPITTDSDLIPARRAHAWRIVAASFREVSPLRSLAAYEQAVALEPSDSSSRFTLAYLYSEQSLDVLARHHYLVLKETNQANATALNNLGVCNRNLNLQGMGFANFFEAGERGSALALANQAHAFLTIGAIREARMAVEKAEPLDPSDARLINARERLGNITREETQRATMLDQLAYPMRGAVAEALDAIDPTQMDVVGQWTLASGRVLDVKQAGKELVAADAEDDWRITLVRNGAHYSAKVRPGKYATALSGYVFFTADRMVILVGGTADGEIPGVIYGQRNDEEVGVIESRPN